MMNGGGRHIDVMIADEDEFVRAGLRTLLGAEPDIRVVAEVMSSAEAIRQSLRLRPDVLILDGDLADGGSLVEACRALRAQARRTRILILIGQVTATAVLTAVSAGVDGCLAKCSRLDDVRRVVRAVAAGEAALDAEVTRIVLDYVRRQPARIDESGAPLSHTECRVLQLVAAGKTNREIAAELDVSEKTIKNWLGHAFGKLHVTRRAQAAVRFTVPGVAPAMVEAGEPVQLRQARKFA